MPNGPFELQHCWGYPKLDPKAFSVSLARDSVLPCPWHRDRYVGTLSYIGAGKKCGDWMVDAGNHRVVLWLPWGIAFVNGGNHSIAAGILSAEGQLHPNEVYDMAQLLDVVQCDGKKFFNRETGQVYDTVSDYKIAALFEVGRLMKQHNIVPMRASS